MAEMQGIFADAKKNRFSSINALSDDGKLNDIDKTKTIQTTIPASNFS